MSADQRWDAVLFTAWNQPGMVSATQRDMAALHAWLSRDYGVWADTRDGVQMLLDLPVYKDWVEKTTGRIVNLVK